MIDLDPKGLLPCPFCGMPPIERDNYEGPESWYIECDCPEHDGMTVRSWEFPTRAEAAAAWNRRHLSAVHDGEGRAVVGTTLNFFASVIKSGEPWTATCQAEFDKAHAALAASRLSQGTGDSERVKALEHEISVHRGAIRRLLDEKGDLGSTMFAKGVLDREMPALSGDTL